MPRINYGYKGPALTPQQAVALNAPTSSQEYNYSVQLGSVSILLPVSNPTGITAVVGDGQVTLSWTAPAVDPSVNPPITDYLVELSIDGGSTWEVYPTSLSSSTSRVISNLVNDTSYLFRVSAVNSAGISTASPSSDPTTPTAVASDEFYANVALLLHADTNLADSSSNNVIVTPVQGAEVSSVQSKWGGGSIRLTPTGRYISIPSSAWPSGTMDFCVEMWIWPDVGTGAWAASWPNEGAFIRGTTVGSFALTTYNMNSWALMALDSAFIGDPYIQWPAGQQWSHLAVSRSGNTFRVYLNGSLVHTATSAVSFPAASSLRLGGYNIPMYVDDLRVTLHSARGYTGSSITVPASAFGDSGPQYAPNAPTSLAATSGNGQVSLSWAAPAFNGGASITDYSVQYSTDGSSWSTFSDGTSTSTSAVVTGLTNNTQYYFRVAAVNSIGTSTYTASVTSTPSVPSVLTITQQPANNFSVSSSDQASFSVAATLPGGTISYQWQAYAYDGNYELNWQNIPNATSSTFNITPASWYTVTGMSIDYINDVRLRCVVTGTNNAGSLTTSEARWVLFSNINRYLDVYGDNGTYPNGSSTVGGQSFSTISMQSGEGVTLFADDMYSGLDTSWYSSNAYTVTVQSSTDGSTWTTAYTPVNLRSAFSVNQPIPAQSGTKYYRVMLTANWPFTTTNSSQSATRSAPEIFIGGAIVTW